MKIKYLLLTLALGGLLGLATGCQQDTTTSTDTTTPSTASTNTTTDTNATTNAPAPK